MPKMTEWRAKKLEDLAKVDAEIRKNQGEKRRISKEYSDTIKDLEEIRDTLLDELAGGEEKALFDDAETDPNIGEPDEPKSTIEFDEEPVPEVGEYLGQPPEPPPGDPEPPPELEDPESFMGE